MLIQKLAIIISQDAYNYFWQASSIIQGFVLESLHSSGSIQNLEKADLIEELGIIATVIEVPPLALLFLQ